MYFKQVDKLIDNKICKENYDRLLDKQTNKYKDS